MLNFKFKLFLSFLLIDYFIDNLFLLKLGCGVVVSDYLSLPAVEVFESWIINFPVEVQRLLLIFTIKEGEEVLEVAAMLGLI